MDKENKLQFFNKAVKIGGSTMVAIPPILVEQLKIDEGNLIGFVHEISKKHGEYLGLWNEDKQKQTKLKK